MAGQKSAYNISEEKGEFSGEGSKESSIGEQFMLKWRYKPDTLSRARRQAWMVRDDVTTIFLRIDSFVQPCSALLEELRLG